jgi:hypothetical protein
LCALLNFLDDKSFKDLTAFQERFRGLSESDQIIELQISAREAGTCIYRPDDSDDENPDNDDDNDVRM